jgi:hypothetical protein
VRTRALGETRRQKFLMPVGVMRELKSPQIEQCADRVAVCIDRRTT